MPQTAERRVELPEWAVKINHPNMAGYAAWLHAHEEDRQALFVDRLHHSGLSFNDAQIAEIASALERYFGSMPG